MKGKYALVYFGFTHCPDICPEELDKMSRMIDIVQEKVGNVMNSIFITCDPARDTPEVVDKYLQEFHPDFIGLTGNYDDIKDVCKKYRVYFSTPKDVKPGQDYLVDHSIYFYLMGEQSGFPAGNVPKLTEPGDRSGRGFCRGNRSTGQCCTGCEHDRKTHKGLDRATDQELRLANRLGSCMATVFRVSCRESITYHLAHLK